jgi:phosphatidylglycerol:prolipoprotein diacylglycerol transferase
MTGWLAGRSGFPSRRLMYLLVLVTAAALLGAKLYGVVERGGGWHGFGWELSRGYRYPGGIAGALVAMPLLARSLLPGRSLLTLGDSAVVGIAIAMTLMRVGCFLAGCCHGVASSLPWAVEFPRGSPAWKAQVQAGLIDERAAASLAVHPLQLYFGVASLAVTVFLLRFRRRQRHAGQLVLIFFVADGTAKFLLEFLRLEQAAHLQWMALGPAVAAGVTLAALWVAQRRQGRVRVTEALAA